MDRNFTKAISTLKFERVLHGRPLGPRRNDLGTDGCLFVRQFRS
jgi:hypothetical protein